MSDPKDNTRIKLSALAADTSQKIAHRLIGSGMGMGVQAQEEKQSVPQLTHRGNTIEPKTYIRELQEASEALLSYNAKEKIVTLPVVDGRRARAWLDVTEHGMKNGMVRVTYKDAKDINGRHCAFEIKKSEFKKWTIAIPEASEGEMYVTAPSGLYPKFKNNSKAPDSENCKLRITNDDNLPSRSSGNHVLVSSATSAPRSHKQPDNTVPSLIALGTGSAGVGALSVFNGYSNTKMVSSVVAACATVAVISVFTGGVGAIAMLGGGAAGFAGWFGAAYAEAQKTPPSSEAGAAPSNKKRFGVLTLLGAAGTGLAGLLGYAVGKKEPELPISTDEPARKTPPASGSANPPGQKPETSAHGLPPGVKKPSKEPQR